MTSDGCNEIAQSGFNLTDIRELKPWTLKEYIEVLENPNALEKFARLMEMAEISPTRLREMINLKFYYSGISARFFFEYSIFEIDLAVSASLERVDSFVDLYDGNGGSSSAKAIHILSYGGKSSMQFSSRFIADQVLDLNRLTPQAFINMVERLGSNANRGAIGVLFELFTLNMINRDWNLLADINLIPPGRDTVINSRSFPYRGTIDEILFLGVWYKPFKPSNPGFDAFYTLGKVREGTDILESLVVVFIQVTCGKKHKFDPEPFATAAMTISRKINGFIPAPDMGMTTRSQSNKTNNGDHTKLEIEIVYAIPTGRKEDFKAELESMIDLILLENLDARWSESRLIYAEVPDSARFRSDYDTLPGATYFD